MQKVRSKMLTFIAWVSRAKQKFMHYGEKSKDVKNSHSHELRGLDKIPIIVETFSRDTRNDKKTTKPSIPEQKLVMIAFTYLIPTGTGEPFIKIASKLP